MSKHVITTAAVLALTGTTVSIMPAHAATVNNLQSSQSSITQQNNAVMNNGVNPMTTPQWLNGNPHLNDKQRQALQQQQQAAKQRQSLLQLPGIVNFASGEEQIYLGEKGLPRIDAWDIFSGSNGGNIVTTSQFKALKEDGLKGVIVKATEGTGYINPMAKDDIANARTAGLNVETYHYAWFANPSQAVNEADYYANELDRLGINKNAGVVLDLEQTGTANSETGSSVAAFFNEMSKRGYHNHVLYTFVSYAQAPAAINVVGNKRTWMAQYPYVPSANDLWHTNDGAWQYSSNCEMIDVTKDLHIIGENDVSIDYDGILTTTPSSASTSKPVTHSSSSVASSSSSVSHTSSTESSSSSAKHASSIASSSSSAKQSSIASSSSKHASTTNSSSSSVTSSVTSHTSSASTHGLIQGGENHYNNSKASSASASIVIDNSSSSTVSSSTTSSNAPEHQQQTQHVSVDKSSSVQHGLIQGGENHYNNASTKSSSSSSSLSSLTATSQVAPVNTSTGGLIQGDENHYNNAGTNASTASYGSNDEPGTCVAQTTDNGTKPAPNISQNHYNNASTASTKQSSTSSSTSSSSLDTTASSASTPISDNHYNNANDVNAHSSSNDTNAHDNATSHRSDNGQQQVANVQNVPQFAQTNGTSKVSHNVFATLIYTTIPQWLHHVASWFSNLF